MVLPNNRDDSNYSKATDPVTGTSVIKHLATASTAGTDTVQARIDHNANSRRLCWGPYKLLLGSSRTIRNEPTEHYIQYLVQDEQ
ncbi:hypothetical protein EVAR_76202_1 [Eumeta japonica]|uniref:Uncharacterized protein n=1 Tax=Eumeta variegata TaxID=151549 RepID=A0A4C1UNT3_EUMVA|nr:hypothetical protein EVAR_76202_1 [Eumeta japonica]